MLKIEKKEYSFLLQKTIVQNRVKKKVFIYFFFFAKLNSLAK